jgi:hypothetical protein
VVDEAPAREALDVTSLGGGDDLAEGAAPE